MDLYIKGLVAQHWNSLKDKKHIKTASFKKKQEHCVKLNVVLLLICLRSQFKLCHHVPFWTTQVPFNKSLKTKYTWINHPITCKNDLSLLCVLTCKSDLHCSSERKWPLSITTGRTLCTSKIHIAITLMLLVIM